jgi:hypothetical protein
MCSGVLNTVGLGVTFLGTLFLLRFGVSFHGDEAGVLLGKGWQKLWLTMEWGQRLSFIILATGFALQLIAQFL